MSFELWLKDSLRHRRVHRKLLQFFYGRRCREAEDLIQETYLHVLSIERQGKIVVHSDQIFLVVARFVWLKRLRDQDPWDPLENPDGSVLEMPGQNEERWLNLLIYIEELAATALSEKDRNLLKLGLEREVEEIAEVLRIPAARVRTRLAQIREKLRVADRNSAGTRRAL